MVRQLVEEEGVSERTQFVELGNGKTLNMKEVKK
jgi:hypothetical protein